MFLYLRDDLKILAEEHPLAILKTYNMTSDIFHDFSV